MAKENLLEISYERFIGSEEITLTIENSSQYGYKYTIIIIEGQL